MAVTRQQRRSGARPRKRRQAPSVNTCEVLARKTYQGKPRYKSPDIQDTITVQAIYAHEEQSISAGEEQENQSHLNQFEGRQHQNTQLLEIQQYNAWLLDRLERENQKTSRLEAELAEERLQNDEGRQLVTELEAGIQQEIQINDRLLPRLSQQLQRNTQPLKEEKDTNGPLKESIFSGFTGTLWPIISSNLKETYTKPSCYPSLET